MRLWNKLGPRQCVSKELQSHDIVLEKNEYLHTGGHRGIEEIRIRIQNDESALKAMDQKQ